MNLRTSDSMKAVVQLVAEGADDGEVLTVAEAHRPESMTAEQYIFTAIDNLRRSELYDRWIGWARKAAAADQVWALEGVGRRWAEWGSRGSLPWRQREAPTFVANVTPEEAQGWVARAATLGSRVAAMDASCWFSDQPEALGWAKQAWGDGEAGQGITAEDLPFLAYRVACLVARNGDDDPAPWFARALNGSRWRHEEGPTAASWVTASAEYCMWLHDSKHDSASCLEWAERILDDEADRGPGDRAYLASEYKTYRYSWLQTSDDVHARIRVMTHLLRDHELGELAPDVALLLSDSITPVAELPQASNDALREAVTGLPHTVRQLLPDAPSGPSLDDAPIDADFAWSFIHWMLEAAVPSILRAVRLPLNARAYAALAPQDLHEADPWQWKQDLAKHGVWPDVTRGPSYAQRHPLGRGPEFDPWSIPSRDEELSIDGVLQFAGLASGPSRRRTRVPILDEDTVWSAGVGLMPDSSLGSDGGSWRILRRRDIWPAMWAAVARDGDERTWVQWWHLAGTHLAAVIRDGIVLIDNTLAGSPDKEARPDPGFALAQKALGAALRSSLTEFLDASTPR